MGGKSMYNENEEVFEEISEREQLENIIADASARLEELDMKQEAQYEGGMAKNRKVKRCLTIRTNGGDWWWVSNYIEPEGRSFPWDFKIVSFTNVMIRGHGAQTRVKLDNTSRIGWVTMTWSEVLGSRLKKGSRVYYTTTITLQNR